MESKQFLLVGMQMLIGDEWLENHAILTEGSKIKKIISKAMINDYPSIPRYEFPAHYYLLPGLIDLHIHGADGSDVMDGSKESLTTICSALAKEGVTGFLATTMTAENTHIESVLQTISEAMQSKEGAAILGVHLEGPFIASEKKGAQLVGQTRMPNSDLIKHWQKLAKGAIKLITLAPELEGSLALIQTLRDMGIVVSVGHTNATFAETEVAIKAGCTHATHLFNAMRGIHQREPGAVGALLLSNQVTAELIVDGLHLHPAIVEMALKLKEKNKLILVTDAMRAKCLGEGEYDLGGQTVVVREGKAALLDGTLAGSTLSMPKAIKNMVQFTQCSLADAIRFATYNPAMVLGLQDCKGTIEVGKDADLVVMNPAFEVVLTICEGKVVYQITG